MSTARVINLIPAMVCASAAQASLVTHAAAGFGGATLLGPDVYGAGHAVAETAYPGAMLRAEAWAEYGWVGARARVEASPALHEMNRGLAEAAFGDRLRLEGLSGAGFIVYTFTLTGAAEGEADAHLFLRHEGDPDEELASEVTGPGVFESLPHAVVFGHEFSMGLSMLVLASMGQGESGVSDGDFAAGAALTGIAVFDGGMSPLGGWVLSSESGTSYPVPAPAGAWCVVGAWAMTGRKRRRNSNKGSVQ